MQIYTIDRKLPKVLYDLNKSLGYFRKVYTYHIYIVSDIPEIDIHIKLDHLDIPEGLIKSE